MDDIISFFGTICEKAWGWCDQDESKTSAERVAEEALRAPAEPVRPLLATRMVLLEVPLLATADDDQVDL